VSFCGRQEKIFTNQTVQSNNNSVWQTFALTFADKNRSEQCATI